MCSICGESTYYVDYDYIGSGTNHLGCELEIEMADDELKLPADMKLKNPGVKSDKRTSSDRRKGDRREKNWLQKKHENKVFGGDTGIDADFGYDDIPEGLKRAKELSQEAIKEGMKSSYKS